MLLAICLLAIVALGHGKPSISVVDDTWELFKSTHKKSYEGDMELARKFIFQENLKYIRQHNFDADLGKHTYWLGVNKFADWSNEEFRAFMNGYKHGNTTTTGSVFLAPANLGDLPKEVDWREKGYVTPVKNQEQCGSCWAFSTTGSLEGQHFRKTGSLVSLSEQNLVDCSNNDQGCRGGWMDYAFDYVQQNNGIDTEECYPYEAVNDSCRYKSSCSGSSCTGHVDIPEGDEDALKTAVATVGPVSVAIDASQLSFQLYRNGVYYEPECNSTKLDHAVLVVGYGTDVTGLDYWIVKNSWGFTWGMNGYILMSRNYNNQCGIATAASYPLV